jgi:hypothetical protein
VDVLDDSTPSGQCKIYVADAESYQCAVMRADGMMDANWTPC